MFAGSKKLYLIAFFTIILIVVVNVVWWVNYRRTEALMDRQISRRLSGIAEAGRVALDPIMLEELVADNFTAYVQVTSLLEQIRRADSLSEVFILNRRYEVLATTALEPDSLYFLAPLNGVYVDSVFYSPYSVTVTTPSYEIGGIYLKTAFTPIYDPTGFTIALLGVEASVDYFDALTDVRNNLYYSGALSILGGLVIGILFLLLQQRISRAEQRLFLNETHSYLGRMVAVVSHEIKNPLMIIRGSAERLRKKSDSEESAFILDEVDRLNRIVTGYLDFAGGKESYVQAEQPQQIRLAEFIDNTRQHVQGKYPDHAIAWMPESTDNSLDILSYPRPLRQVILNLLINGAEACLNSSKDIVLGVQATERGDSIKIRVSDQGPGIDKREIKRLFTPFYTTKQSGSGLGLYLSKKIVEEMGGTLDIESDNVKGTVATITLPKHAKKHG